MGLDLMQEVLHVLYIFCTSLSLLQAFLTVIFSFYFFQEILCLAQRWLFPLYPHHLFWELFIHLCGCHTQPRPKETLQFLWDFKYGISEILPFCFAGYGAFIVYESVCVFLSFTKKNCLKDLCLSERVATF